MLIEVEKCIGCGKCVEDCITERIALQEGKAVIKADARGTCIECGHCVAICPAGAIRLPGYAEDTLQEYNPAAFDIPAQQLLNFMQFRRSIRKFTAQDIEDEKLQLMLEAGRYAPSGSNRQKVRYILIRDQKKEIVRAAAETLYQAAMHTEKEKESRGAQQYRQKLISFYHDLTEKGRDSLSYNAPCILLVVGYEFNGGSGLLDCGLASAYTELMANALGLGACYIGFFSMAVKLNPSLAEMIGLQTGEKLISTLAIGYPDVKYYRTVNRKKANITYL